MTAGHLLETLCRHFSKFSLPLEISTNIVPDDGSTLFICSGMQPLKPRFQSPDGLGYGSIQDCIRVNDIDIVGDGSHLTFFQMVGSFGFGTNDYEMHIDLWDSILTDLKLGPLEIHIYPGWDKHKLWTRRGYQVISDLDCTWSDGTVSGMCSEVYLRGLEIGNLVNPLGHSVDVGFGFERLLQVISGADRVDETEVFRQDLDPISRDHYRTLTSLFRNGVEPGNKGRNYVCRRILRRFLHLNTGLVSCPFEDWLRPERDRLEKNIGTAKRFYRRNQHKPLMFWWDSFGLLPEEVKLLG